MPNLFPPSLTPHPPLFFLSLPLDALLLTEPYTNTVWMCNCITHQCITACCGHYLSEPTYHETSKILHFSAAKNVHTYQIWFPQRLTHAVHLFWACAADHKVIGDHGAANQVHGGNVRLHGFGLQSSNDWFHKVRPKPEGKDNAGGAFDNGGLFFGLKWCTSCIQLWPQALTICTAETA